MDTGRGIAAGQAYSHLRRLNHSKTHTKLRHTPLSKKTSGQEWVTERAGTELTLGSSHRQKQQALHKSLIPIRDSQARVNIFVHIHFSFLSQYIHILQANSEYE